MGEKVPEGRLRGNAIGSSPQFVPSRLTLLLSMNPAIRSGGVALLRHPDFRAARQHSPTDNWERFTGPMRIQSLEVGAFSP